MKCVIQRVLSASVSVDAEVISRIGKGMLVLAAVEKGDTHAVVNETARKLRELRIFADDKGKMNLNVREVAGAILAVSQFTLAGSLSRGRRPSFERAEAPDPARLLFEHFVEELGRDGVPVSTGRFRAMMVVALENDGPVTFIYDSNSASSGAA